MNLLSSPARVASDGFHRKPVASTAMAFLLLACANPAASGAASLPADTESTMNPDISFVPPQLTAEQALSRVLELIGGSQSIADFTPERLEQVMGVLVGPRWGGYGFAERLTPKWSHGFEVGPWDGQTKFYYSFTPSPSPPPGASVPMTEVCQMDFERFASELEAMGFNRGSVYDSPPQPPPEGPHLLHGRRMYDLFNRSGLTVEVWPRRESRERLRHVCLEWVYIY